MRTLKKFRSLLVVLALLAVVAAGAIGTQAWFTDQDTAVNDLTAGRLDVELRGADADGVVIALDTTQYFKGGMRPGVPEGPYEIDVYNKGWGQSTMTIKYRWSENQTGGSGPMYDKMNVEVRHSFCGTDPVGWPVIYSGPLDGMVIDSESPPSGTVLGGGHLDPNITHCWAWWFELDSTADNTLQAANVQFDLVLDATQPENPGWTE